jgi:LL-diaminopimelate aminotransferase
MPAMKRNPHITRLKGSYLFPEVNARKAHFLSTFPNADLISLGIGDTTEPLPAPIADALAAAAKNLGCPKHYSGYGPELGISDLRNHIAHQLYSNRIQPSEVFISDGAKCDIGRWQMLFGSDVSIAVQDPAYPVYIDGSTIQGVKKIIYMPCTPANNFFPDLESLPHTDLIYFCSPNNPTGAVATRPQLEKLVAFAQRRRSIILFDAAYACYIGDPELPKSIFEIDGAREVAIEIGSFSKLAGFTGVRLGWSIVPHELKYDDGSSIHADWQRLVSTLFNGASNISQQGGLAVLTPQGQSAIAQTTRYYMGNAALIKERLHTLGYTVFGGTHAPYLWVDLKGRNSWELFQYFLETFHLITTPGSGFGVAGEGFLRLTAFGQRQSILRALERLQPLPSAAMASASNGIPG